jgi:hypothetical protein
LAAVNASFNESMLYPIFVNLTYFDTNPFGWINYTTGNTTDEIFSVCDNSTFSPIDEPLWAANYSALNDSWSSTYNSSYLTSSYNTTYDALVSDNTSWNESIAAELFYGISNPFNFFNDSTVLNVNSSIYCSYMDNSTERDIFMLTYNQTYDALISYNATWNQTLGDELYYSVSNPWGFINYTTGNTTDEIFAVCDNSTFIKTELDPLWSGNYTALNSSWSTTFNSTYDAKISYNSTFNQTLTDLLYAGLGESLWSGNYSALNDSWSTTYNLTYSQWNKTYADGLYQSAAGNTTAQVQNAMNNTGLLFNVSTWVANDTKMYFGSQKQYCIYYNSSLQALVSTNVC